MKKRRRRSTEERQAQGEAVPANARELAFVVLREHQRSGEFVASLLDARLKGADLSPEERRPATEMIYGIVRRQRTLARLIQPRVKRPREQIEPALWTLLEIGAYQLVFMESVPPHAAVNETVNLCRRLGEPRWSGFLNGVLRAVARELTDEISESPAADAVPLAEGNYRKCKDTLFPEPQKNPTGHFAEAFSFPDWLAERWEERFAFEELVRLGFWFNAPAKLWLRVNTIKTTREEVLAAFAEAGIEASPGDLPEAIRLESSARPEQLPGFAEGWLTVQDHSAMQAARLLCPKPGAFVLDLCAAPGTKTTHLAELMQNVGQIIAADVNAGRLQRVEENARRLGIEMISTQVVSEEASDLPAGPFEAILVDAPCSNTGVLGKRPEARWRLRPRDLTELAAVQKTLLEAAAQRLKPAGRLVYSTCAIEPEENQQVVRALLESCPQLRLECEIEQVPGRPADGGYQALLVRES